MKLSGGKTFLILLSTIFRHRQTDEQIYYISIAIYTMTLLCSVIRKNRVRQHKRVATFAVLSFSARQHSICSARYMLSSVRPSVCLTHGWISQNGWNYDYYIFTLR